MRVIVGTFCPCRATITVWKASARTIATSANPTMPVTMCMRRDQTACCRDYHSCQQKVGNVSFRFSSPSVNEAEGSLLRCIAQARGLFDRLRCAFDHFPFFLEKWVIFRQWRPVLGRCRG